MNKKMSVPGVGPRQALRNCKQPGSGGPLLLFSGRGRTTSSVASVLSLSSTSSLRRSLALSVLFLQNSHLHCLSGGVVRGIDVHPVVRGIDETSTSSGGTILPSKIAAWEDEHVPEDSTFTGEEAGTPPLATPTPRRLRQEKEPAQHEPRIESESDVDRREPRPFLEAEAAGHYDSTQYLALEANGAGFENQPWMAGNRRGQREPSVDAGRNRKPSTHLPQPSGASHSHSEHDRVLPEKESRNGLFSGSSADQTSVSLTVVDATASSEYGTATADKLIDDDITKGSNSHTSSHLPSSPTSTPASAALSGTKEETPVTTTSPVRRLRQENKEPAQQVGPSATSRETSPTSTDQSRDRRSQVLEAEDAEGYYNSTQYLALEANGVGGDGEGLISSKREATIAAHADRRGWGQRVPTVDGDGESERDTNRDLRKPLHLRQPIAGSHSHFEQQRRGSYASAATVGGDAARRESRSGSSGAASRHTTSGPLTVDAATASSEYGGRQRAENLIDGNITTVAHTSDALPAAQADNGRGQRCPWWQLDLGATKAVDKVKLTAEKMVKRMRRLLFVEHIWMTGTDVDMEEGTRADTGGVRVLVGNSARNRADTSEFNSARDAWSGNDVGPICPEPATGEECETIRCDEPTNCLNRFAEESSATDIGTAEVNCNGKQGRYVTIELPGVHADDTDLIRTGALTEVRVEGGPAQDESTSTSPPPASAESKRKPAPLVIGGVVVLALVLGGVGAAFAL